MFTCENGCKIDHVLFDGYPVGDRMLEGVMFECRKNEHGEWQVNISPKYASYFEDLNQAKWLKAVKDALPENDYFQCPSCFGDIFVEVA